jgi:hypothetical protein
MGNTLIPCKRHSKPPVAHAAKTELYEKIAEENTSADFINQVLWAPQEPSLQVHLDHAAGDNVLLPIPLRHWRRSRPPSDYSASPSASPNG